MVNNFIVKCLMFVCFLALPFRSVFGASLDNYGGFDFNVIMQNAIPSIIKVSTAGTYDGTPIGIYKPSDPTVKNTLTFSGGSGWINHKLIITLPTSSINISATGAYGNACSISFSGFSVSANNVYLSGSATNISVGATMTINEFCQPDTYSGKIYDSTFNFKTQECFLGWICYSESEPENINFGYEFDIEETLDVAEIVPLNFGAILPIGGKAGVVTVYPNGDLPYTTDGLRYISSATRGEWQVYGIGGRPVNISLQPSVTLTNESNSSATMTVDTFTYANSESEQGGQVSIPDNSLSYDARTNFYVGATLHVKENQTPGMYSGEYTVTVSY